MPFGDLGIVGYWNAATNDRGLKSGKGIKGEAYIVNVAGTTSIDGNADWNIGDVITFGPDYWIKLSAGNIGPETQVFETTEEAIGATLADGVEFVITYGYYEPGDLGQGMFKVVLADPTPVPSILFAGGKYGEYINDIIRFEMFGGTPIGSGNPLTHPDQRAYVAAGFAASDAMVRPIESDGAWPINSALPNPLWNHTLNITTGPGFQIYARYPQAADEAIINVGVMGIQHVGQFTVQTQSDLVGGIGIRHKNPVNTASVGLNNWDSLWIGGVNHVKALVIDGRLNVTPSNGAVGARNFKINKLTAFNDVDLLGVKFLEIGDLQMGGGTLNMDADDAVIYTDGVQVNAGKIASIRFGETRRSFFEGDCLGICYNTSAEVFPTYNPVTAYALNDVVYYPTTWKYYRSLSGGNTGNTPSSSPAFWTESFKKRGSLFCNVRGRVAGVSETNWLTQRYNSITGEWLGPLTDENGNKSYSCTDMQKGTIVARRFDVNGTNGWELYADGRIMRQITSATNGIGVKVLNINDTADNNLAGPTFVGADYLIKTGNVNSLGLNAPATQIYDLQANWDLVTPFRINCVAKLIAEPAIGSDVINLQSLSFTLQIWGTATV